MIKAWRKLAKSAAAGLGELNAVVEQRTRFEDEFTKEQLTSIDINY